MSQEAMHANLRGQEDELQLRMLKAVAKEVLHGHPPVDGIHEDIKLIHSPEWRLGMLAQGKSKGHCGVALLTTCSSAACCAIQHCCQLVLLGLQSFSRITTCSTPSQCQHARE